MRMRWTNLPIPEVHVRALVAGLILHRLAPVRLLPRARLGHALGWPVLGAGLLLTGWAVAAIGELEIEAPTQLIATGPYAYSRNPMYIAWTLINIGIAFMVNTVWVLMFMSAALIYTHWVVIPREEQHLEGTFGDEYRRYKRRVRRYL